MAKEQTVFAVSFEAVLIFCVLAGAGLFFLYQDSGETQITQDAVPGDEQVVDARKKTVIAALTSRCHNMACFERESMSLIATHFPASEGYTERAREVLQKNVLGEIKRDYGK